MPESRDITTCPVDGLPLAECHENNHLFTPRDLCEIATLKQSLDIARGLLQAWMDKYGYDMPLVAKTDRFLKESLSV